MSHQQISLLLHTHHSKLELLQSNLKYKFRDIHLLVEALTHPSLNHNQLIRNYERLEFLGDSVLNLVISEVLFHKFTYYREGQLAKIKSFLVCDESIHLVSQKINIPQCIIMSKSEEKSGGRANKNNIEDSMEAVIGAIYLDSDIYTAQDIVLNLWKDLIDNYREYLTADSKSALQEWSQSQNLGIPIYKLVLKQGDDHNPWFRIAVIVGNLPQEYGEGKTLKMAQKHAAKKMLEYISKTCPSNKNVPQ